MNYTTIGEIYDANAAIREKLLASVQSFSAEAAWARAEDQKWSVAEVLEHVAMVADGSLRICTKLLNAARDAGRTSDGNISLSEHFKTKGLEIADIKLEAPAMVQPKHGSDIDTSLARLAETAAAFEELRPFFEQFDCTAETFPHPFIGPMTAVEWLVLAGAHEARHLRQIERLSTSL